MAFYAFDKNGVMLNIGTVVKFTDTKLKYPKDRIGPIDEIIFKSDGSVMVRIVGAKNKAVPTKAVETVQMTDKEKLLYTELTRRGVLTSVEEVRNLLVLLSLDGQDNVSSDEKGDEEQSEWLLP